MTNELATTNTNNTNNDIVIPNGAFNTIDMSDFNGAVRLANAINASGSLAEYVQNNNNPELPVVDIIVTNGVRKGRNGMDDMPCEDTRLILADGTSLLSQSTGIANSARWIAGILGTAIHEGILLQVVTQQLNNGNTIKNLRIVGKMQ